MSQLTFVRPEGDWVEQGLSCWAQLLLSAIAGKTGLTVTDLRSTHVKRAPVEAAISGADLVIFFVHGQKDRLGDPIALVDSKNVFRLSGIVVIAFSCEVGDQLGFDAVANGSRAFLGFNDFLVNYHAQPVLFGYAVQASVQPFILSSQPIGAVHAMLELKFKNIEHHYRIGIGQHHVDATLIWMAARMNWRGLVLYGDPLAKL